MLLLSRLQNPMSSDLLLELLDLCADDMLTVAEKLSLDLEEQAIIKYNHTMF